MAGQKVLALSAGIKDATTQRAVRSLERAIEGISVPAPQTPGLFSATQQGEVPASGGGTSDFLRADGAWAAPPSGGGGSGLFSSFISAVVPTQANTGFTSWLGSPTGVTATDLSKGMTVATAGSASAAGLRVRAAPTPPYTITALVMSQALCSSTSGGDGALRFGWSDGTKLQVFQFDVVSGTPGNYLSVVNFPSITGSAAATPWFVGANTTGMAPFIWLRLRDDGTNFSFDFGFTGEDWLTPVSAAKSAGYLAGSYSNVVFGVNFANIPTQAKLLSWSIS